MSSKIIQNANGGSNAEVVAMSAEYLVQPKFSKVCVHFLLTFINTLGSVGLDKPCETLVYFTYDSWCVWILWESCLTFVWVLSRPSVPFTPVSWIEDIVPTHCLLDTVGGRELSCIVTLAEYVTLVPSGTVTLSMCVTLTENYVFKNDKGIDCTAKPDTGTYFLVTNYNPNAEQPVVVTVS